MGGSEGSLEGVDYKGRPWPALQEMFRGVQRFPEVISVCPTLAKLGKSRTLVQLWGDMERARSSKVAAQSFWPTSASRSSDLGEHLCHKHRVTD